MDPALRWESSSYFVRFTRVCWALGLSPQLSSRAAEAPLPHYEARSPLGKDPPGPQLAPCTTKPKPTPQHPCPATHPLLPTPHPGTPLLLDGKLGSWRHWGETPTSKAL